MNYYDRYYSDLRLIHWLLVLLCDLFVLMDWLLIVNHQFFPYIDNDFVRLTRLCWKGVDLVSFVLSVDLWSQLFQPIFIINKQLYKFWHPTYSKQ